MTYDLRPTTYDLLLLLLVEVWPAGRRLIRCNAMQYVQDGGPAGWARTQPLRYTCTRARALRPHIQNALALLEKYPSALSLGLTPPYPSARPRLPRSAAQHLRLRGYTTGWLRGYTTGKAAATHLERLEERLGLNGSTTSFRPLTQDVRCRCRRPLPQHRPQEPQARCRWQCQ